MKRKNKYIAILCCAVMTGALMTACGEGTADASVSDSGNATTTFVQVESIEAGLVTAVVGEMPEFQDGEMPEFQEGEMPDMGSASGERPERPDDMGSGDMTPPEAPDGEMPEFQEGERPEMPSGDVGSGEFPEGEGPGGGRGGMGFIAGDETVTFNVTDDTLITVASMDGDQEGSLDDITVGAILEVEIDADGNAASIVIRSFALGGFGSEMPDRDTAQENENATDETDTAV